MPAKKQNNISTVISWDWKSSPSLEELRAALEPFGICVYEDPMMDGSDTYGYIFTNKKPMNSDQVEELSRELNDWYDEDQE